MGGPDPPSAEAPLDVEIVRQRGAGAGLHTHSIWSTVRSGRHAAQQQLWIENYEMLKGLGVHRRTPTG
jgi:methylthioribulose-1-phosphate dehydratase